MVPGSQTASERLLAEEPPPSRPYSVVRHWSRVAHRWHLDYLSNQAEGRDDREQDSLDIGVTREGKVNK